MCGHYSVFSASSGASIHPKRRRRGRHGHTRHYTQLAETQQDCLLHWFSYNDPRQYPEEQEVETVTMDSRTSQSSAITICSGRQGGCSNTEAFGHKPIHAATLDTAFDYADRALHPSAYLSHEAHPSQVHASGEGISDNILMDFPSLFSDNMDHVSIVSSGGFENPAKDMYSTPPLHLNASAHSRGSEGQSSYAPYMSPSSDEVLTFEHSMGFHIPIPLNGISSQYNAPPTYVVPSIPLPHIPPQVIIVAHPSGPQCYTHSGARSSG